MPLRLQFAITTVLAALLAVGWLWFAGWGDAAQSSETRARRSTATPVLVEVIGLAEDRTVVRVVGTGEALRSASLYPSVSGAVVDVAFHAEQRVAEGALLLRLDNKHQQLGVRLARIAVKEAGRQVKRLEKLAPSGAVSQVRLETAQAALESATVRLDQAKAALADRTVHAPFTGVIGLTEIDKGDRITEDTLIATLDDRSVILVKFNVPEEYAGRIGVGMPVSVRPWTMPEREMQGMVSATGSRIDATTRSLRVRARIVNPDDAIRPGTSFDVRLSFTGRSYPSVREVAVLWSRDGAYLWRVVDGKAEKVFVTMVRRDQGRVLVEGPLQAGDTIVVEGVQGLRPDQAVTATPFGSDKAGTDGRANAGGNS